MNPQSDVNSTVAPWPGQDDGDEGRRQRGLAIAALVNIKKNKLGYAVPSQSGSGSYVVNTDGGNSSDLGGSEQLTAGGERI